MQTIMAFITLLVLLITASVAVEHMFNGRPFKQLLFKYAHLWTQVFVMVTTALITCLAVIATTLWRGFPSLFETWKKHRG